MVETITVLVPVMEIIVPETVVETDFCPWHIDIESEGAGYVRVHQNASINNLQYNAFTLDGWFKVKNIALGLRYIFHKDVGFIFYAYQPNQLWWSVYDQVNGEIYSYGGENDEEWHYFMGTWDNNGDRKTRVYIDGTLMGTSPNAGSGNPNDDSALDFNAMSSNGYGSIGWYRLSNVIRSNVLRARDEPPEIDVNTVFQVNVNEGEGDLLKDLLGNTDGHLTNTYSWSRI